MEQTGIAVGAAAVAGGFLAATGVLQQRAARRRPEGESLSPRLLWSLAHDSTCLLGIGSGVAAYGFQALALAFGPLALVQPVFLSELIFAVPTSVRLNHMRLGLREWSGLLAVAGGLVLGILSARPQPGDSLPPLTSWGAASALIIGVAVGCVLVGRALSGPARSSMYAFAGGSVMALQSALLAATVAHMKQGPVPLFTTWQGYALIPATAAGILLITSAYQAGPLAASMPVIDASEPSVAIVIGVTIFSEHIRTAPLDLAGTALGLLLFFLGIILLDTSPVVQALQRKEDQSQAAPAEARE